MKPLFRVILLSLLVLSVSLSFFACANPADDNQTENGNTPAADTVPGDSGTGTSTATDTAADTDSGTLPETQDPCVENGHRWDVIKDRPANCLREGKHTLKCSVCGETAVETPEQLEHRFENGVCVACGLVENAETRFDYKASGVDGYCVRKSTNDADTVVAGQKELILPNVYYDAVSDKIRPVISVNQLFEVDCLVEKLVIPEGYTVIGGYAFVAWDRLYEVSLPSTLQEIQVGAFQNCTSLTEIVIPDSVRRIGEDAFSGCKNLKRIVIPDSVTSIGARAFYGCTSLEEVVLPAGLKTLSSQLFLECSSLKTAVIPQSVTRIEAGCFQGTGLETVTIPASCKDIREHAFAYTRLKEVDILAVGIKLGYAFHNCADLEKVTFAGQPEKINTDEFANCPKLTDIEYNE